MPVCGSVHCSAAMTDLGHRRATASAATKRTAATSFLSVWQRSDRFRAKTEDALFHKKGRLRLSVRFSFERETFCARSNFPVGRVIDRHDRVRTSRRVFGRSSGTRADAAGNYNDVSADCSEGRAECCNSIYYTNGVAW